MKSGRGCHGRHAPGALQCALLTLKESIAAAWSRRASLHAAPDLDVYRVFHGWEEGYQGIMIDRYGELIAVECASQKPIEQLPEVVEALDACRRFEHIVARPRGATPFALRGEVPVQGIVVHEHGMRFVVRLTRPGNPGLFLDARPARQWIRDHSRDRRVLNLFAFTGSLGIAAALGGARSVVHVDSARSSLDACRKNHELNGIPIDERCLARMNVYQHLRRQGASRQRFDAIIVDPPPLSGLALRTDRTPGGRGVEALVPLALRMLAPGGWLLCFFHHDEREHEDIERAMSMAAGQPLAVIWRGESGPDFPESTARRKLRLGAFAVAGDEMAPMA